MNDLIALISFIFIIVVLLVDRYFLTEQHRHEKTQLLDELSRATKAIMAKNAHEYVMTTSIDKVPSEPLQRQQDPTEIPEESLTDDEFFHAIGRSLEDDKKK
jgi:hypothetical protein